ncbi:ParA family protein [Sediminibacterium sp.]|uniref:ParA family protein n=1 Tax=Sediminibacterium sp. TaxID=1917865 RepID=UPI0027254A48|nr:AAA family ATPase [Sediminibacterium sp.]MDO9155683.1 AAA family ATPase [Sediminibacterium sp.]MDP1973821.1 AAA family ATPase [Sediminibacterium sp.]MDP2420540.1 AAA family ATPase [Sediminibacterium sp.]
MVTIALYNLKGGVGKTAATINLTYLSAKQGYKTLIWDLDPQGSSSFYLGATANVKNEAKKILTGEMDLASAIQPSAYENLDIIPADLSARHADILLNEMKQSKKKISAILSTIKNEYDIVFLDCPPGISVLHDAVFAGVDWILMPNIPTTLSIRSFESVLNYFKENDLDTSKLKCFFSMVDHRKNLHHEVINEFYKDKLFFKSYIPYLSDVEKMGVHESPLETFAASSYAAQCYKDLWKEIKQRCIN